MASIGLNRTSIGNALGYSRNTVADVFNRAQEKEVSWDKISDTDDATLKNMLYPEKAAQEINRRQPNFEKIHKDLGRRGVTFSLLWDEYCAECRALGEIPYGYTQFRYHYYSYANQNKATMHIEHKPGYAVEVDWAGATLSIIDSMTGEILTAYLFVGVLPYSGYVYAEAFLNMTIESWINAHAHMLTFYQGVPSVITPDNLKTGIIKAEYYDPILNRSYGEMTEYYGCVVLPTRVKKPKDKPTVEGSVGKVTTWIIAALRDRKFFTIQDLNEAVFEKLNAFNSREFPGRTNSRLSNYLDEEKEFMRPLPATPYEMAVWKKLTPGFNYHLAFEKNYYSVPCQYIKHEVDVRITGAVVEVFADGLRICSHRRLYGKSGQYSTNTEHMPEKHRKYGEWNSNRFIKWANSVGENTEIVIKAILTNHVIEQQGYRACMGVLKLAERNGAVRLEAACKRALTYTPSPTYKHIDSIIKTGQDKISQTVVDTTELNNPHAFVRGADYYKRRDK